MSPVAVVLVLLSALIHVGWNLQIKSSANPKSFALVQGVLLVGIGAIALPAIPLRSIAGDVWIYVALSGAIHMIYTLALSTAYETGDISYVYPISRSAPAFVPIAAFFVLGEGISLQGALGIAIVVACVFLIQVRGEARSELQRLLTSVKQKDSRWAFITLASVVAYTLVDKAGMVAFNRVGEISHGLRGPVYFLLQNFPRILLFWIYLACRHEVKIGPMWKAQWHSALAAAFGMMASYSLILHVMQAETVSYIVTLRQSSVLLAVLVGWRALREQHGGRRLIAGAGMFLGFFLVATAK